MRILAGGVSGSALGRLPEDGSINLFVSALKGAELSVREPSRKRSLRSCVKWKPA